MIHVRNDAEVAKPLYGYGCNPSFQR
jgi:hypothetical protein